MVLKGAAARKLKKAKFEGRPERSLYVICKNRPGRDRIVEILSSAHPDIERVFLPRQPHPRSAYVLCKGESERKSVRDVLRKLKNEELGRIKAKYPKLPKVEEKSPLSNNKRVIDRCTLLLEWIPVKLETEEIEKAFPKAIKVDRFNKRRCYVKFKNAKDAMKARIRLSSEEIGGHKLTAKFNKIEGSDETAQTVTVAGAEGESK